MQGKIIIFEGIDGSGKSTQYKKLCERLKTEGFKFRTVTFPRYSEESSALIRSYLSGQFGSRPDDVNAYAASTFYAVDRYASYKTDWGGYYEMGGLVLADRYTTSNACHQASKLKGKERDDYLSWLYDFEFRLMGLPKPDTVFYMNTELEISVRQMRERESETGTGADIHEKDIAYLGSCLEAGRYSAEKYGWQVIECAKDGQMRSIEDIHEEIYRKVRELI